MWYRVNIVAIVMPSAAHSDEEESMVKPSQGKPASLRAEEKALDLVKVLGLASGANETYLTT